ncbi:hypothetical protein SAMN05444412_101297 [Rhodonellum ikkaensis]|uniref:Uncharacterized protein n=1 Tax=Rhodonellum ikkaensis TaxID=336829 RepID=A0A1H3K9F1_9BACT|nr:hypothetical protein SAMN05444412_101297 [Rhodonellum ikkaensis]
MFYFLHGMTLCSGCQDHLGQGQILCSDGSHAGAIGHVDIGAGMGLVVFVEQGCFGIMPHSDTSLFVDPQSGRPVIAPGFDR